MAFGSGYTVIQVALCTQIFHQSYTHFLISNTFVHKLLNDTTTLTNVAMLHLRGKIPIPDLAQAVQALGGRQETLRTCFHTRDGQLIQGALASSSLTLEHKAIYA